MKYAFAQVAFGLGANALVAREAAQCVQLKASGGASGVLGQLGDGQNRIGGGHDTGCYCLSNGGFTDSNGRGCILTEPTTQWQCDAGATPSTGFAIGSGGGVTSNGNGKFYACPVNENGEYNVYTKPAPGQDKCVEISLSSAGSCGAGAGPQSSQPAPKPSQPAQSEKPAPTPSQPAYSQKPAPTPEQPAPKPSQPAQSEKPAPTPSQPAYSQKPAPTPEQPAPKPSKPAESQKPAPTPEQPAPKPSKPAESQKPAPTPEQPAPQPSKPAEQSSKPAPQPSQPAPKPSGSCPADLNGNYEYPHLIVPVDSSSPNKAPGTSYNGKVDKTTCSIFNFDIPASYSGKTCSVVFLFPKKEDLETSDYTVSGNGQCSFSKLSSPADQQTSYANQPKKESELASMSIAPGNSYVVASGDCEAGKTVSYEMCGQGDFSLDFFQDYNPSPLGLYVRQC